MQRHGRHYERGSDDEGTHRGIAEQAGTAGPDVRAGNSGRPEDDGMHVRADGRPAGGGNTEKRRNMFVEMIVLAMLIVALVIAVGAEG